MAKVNYSGLFDYGYGEPYKRISRPNFITRLRRALRPHQGTAELVAQVEALNGANVGVNNVVVKRTRVAARVEREQPSMGIIPIETVTIRDSASTNADRDAVNTAIVDDDAFTFPKNENDVDLEQM